MRPITLEDVLPLEEYAARRREFFETHHRYLDRRRRVRVGPKLMLVFENRQTLWFRLQEVLRIARLAETAQIQRELDLFNRLLPEANRLQAALLIEMDESRLVEELAAWRNLSGSDIRLQLGDASVPADLLTCRPEDRCIGTAHWIQFTISREYREALADPDQCVRVRVQNSNYEHDSLPLSDEIRRSLFEDLQMSER